LLAIAVGILSAVLLSAFALGIRTQLIEDSILNLTGHIQIRNPDFTADPVIEHSFQVPARLLEKLKGDKRVRGFTSRVRVPGVVGSERDSAGVVIVGIDPEKEKALSFLGTSEIEGNYFRDEQADGIIIGRALLEKLETKIGRRIVLMTEDVDGELADRGFTIVGVFDAELESTEKAFVFVTKPVLQNLLKLEEKVSEVSVLLFDDQTKGEVSSELSKLAPELQVLPWTELQPLIVALVKVQSGFLRLWYVIVVIALGFGLVNTLFMSIYERMREIGLLQALGMSPKMILLLIVFECLVLLVFGCVLGNGLSYLTVFALSDGINVADFSKGTEIVGIRSIIIPRLVMSEILWANSIILILSLLTSLYPAWKAAKLVPMEALRKG
jgi:ABC-type lipoprotein release transport system permease subunit